MIAPPSARRSAVGALFRLWVVNLAVAIALAYRYLLASPAPDGFNAVLYSHVLLVSAVSTLYGAAYLFLWIPVWLVPRRAVLVAVAGPTLFVLAVLLLLDTSIFRIYRFHINGMVLNLLATDGAWDTLSLGRGTWLSAVGLVLGVLLLEMAATLWSLREWRTSDTRPRARRWHRALPLVVVAGLLACTVAEKVVYAVADLRGITAITRQARLFPLYQPVTIRRFAGRWLGIEAASSESPVIRASRGSLDYPKQAIEGRGEARPPNILWVVIDGFRSDMLSPEVTPSITRLATSSLDFRNHVSGGNATRFGTFSLFYGLYGSYWHPFLGERRGPVLIDELLRRGYQFEVIATTRLSFPEFRDTVFVRVQASIEDRLPGTGATERDPVAADRLDSFLQHRDPARPFFAVVFLNAAHGPYSYPPAFRVFQPATDQPNYVTTSARDVVALRNAYRNALRFDDAVTERMLAALERQHLAEDTLVLVTGDHGEEFLEHGSFGHTGSFSPEQTRVPLVLRVPRMAPAVVTRLTSHLDIVPTVMSLLGVTTAPGSYSQGSSLLASTGREFAVCMGWDQGAILDGEGAVVFSTETYNAAFFEVRDANYQLMPDPRSAFARRRTVIDQVVRGMREFLR